MTDEQATQLHKKMLEIWPQLPNPEHEPKQFEFYMNMFRYYHLQEVKNILGVVDEVPQEAS